MKSMLGRLGAYCPDGRAALLWERGNHLRRIVSLLTSRMSWISGGSSSRREHRPERKGGRYGQQQSRRAHDLALSCHDNL